MAIKTQFSTFYIVLVLIVLCHCAPRSKNKQFQPQTVYDQKQTGDYNIQLHLKDFQIIALLGDDSLGGDYDYSYDYSDFTIKPTGSTTQKPNLTENNSTASVNNTTNSTAGHPYEILYPATSTKAPESPVSSSNDSLVEDKPLTSNITDTESQTNTTNSEPITPRDEYSLNSGKIKVQILETPVLPAVGIVPGEDVGPSQDNLPSGEVVHYRRCASGFTRDKKGRCRRVRRPNGAISPQLPFGISRLASNLASRFRYNPSEAIAASASPSPADALVE